MYLLTNVLNLSDCEDKSELEYSYEIGCAEIIPEKIKNDMKKHTNVSKIEESLNHQLIFG